MSKVSFLFGTVGTPHSKPNSPGGTVGGVMHIRKLDLDAMEIGWVRSVRVSDSTCAKIKETAQEHEVDLSVHAPYYINLNADDEEWPNSRERLMDAAIAGYKSGATDIVFHPGSYFERPPEEVLKVVMPRLEGCVEELQDGGFEVTLRPETMGKGAMLGSLQDTLEMSRIPSVEPCLDFAHLHARPGDGSMNSYDEWMEVFDRYADALGPESLQRIHCHVSGIAYTEKGEQEHLTFEEADFDLDGLLRALDAADARGRLLCESPILEEDAVVMRDRWFALSGESKEN